MKERDFMDIGRLMDEIFEAAEDFTHAFTQHYHPGGKSFRWTGRDFYPMYSYPPANIYMKGDKTLVFEFALAGFTDEDVNVEFKGDYMHFSADEPEHEVEDGVRYFKRRLKFKSVAPQKYFVPADKFKREETKAVFANGVLTVTIPPKEEVDTEEGIKVNVVNEDETGSGKGKSTKSGQSGKSAKSGPSARTTQSGSSTSAPDGDAGGEE